MERKDLIKACKYYKGEEECPEGHNWHPFVRFWNMERMYCNTFMNPIDWFGKHYEHAYQMWETEGLEMCLDGNDDISKFFEREKFSILQKGMLAFIVIRTYDNDPMGGIDFIFDYGK